jgi:putative protease
MAGLHHPLELLSPARNLECGIAAVNHGADAVYIGAPRFSARAAAGNSLEDIEKLIRYAHIYSARIYIALNTLFGDEEIDEAVRLARALYDAGADALIIQDMGLLECGLPPIPLHASTQADNRTPEKVKFLEDTGFAQAVLARELGLEEIRRIRARTTIPLEFFIHGALCVSYSGQCYISELVAGRSANRGECAQFCRHRYTLKDSGGRVIGKEAHYLSMKDLDLSDHIGALIDAGISSFKIEGRLKDAGYVKNITAHYRGLLDRRIEAGAGSLRRSSSGRCVFGFTPDPAKSFNRGRTDYFLNRSRAAPAAPDTPKFTGEIVGEVERSGRDFFTLKAGARPDDDMHNAVLRNGDGLAFFDASGILAGFKANRVEGRTVYVHDALPPPAGTVVYRNFDAEFDRLLQNSGQCRFLEVDADIRETPDGLRCVLADEEGIRSVLEMPAVKAVSNRPGTIEGVIERQFRKTGGTVFRVGRVTVSADPALFVRAADINELRRRAFEGHLEKRLKSFRRRESPLSPNRVPWLSDRVTWRDNITNSRARDFYRRHGVSFFYLDERGLQGEADVVLMTTRYCLRAQLGICPRDSAGTGKSESLREPPEHFTLSDNTGVYELEFDCARCGMSVRRL